eukprot:jgi/Picsp_1/196/NSC_00195-R1_protein
MGSHCLPGRPCIASYFNKRVQGLVRTNFGNRAQQVVVQADKKDDGLDFVERIFGKVFGSQALETDEAFGLKRVANDLPEIYPAVIDEFADPLPEDSVESVDPDVIYIRQLLAKTQLEKTPLRLAYDSSVHGLSMESFGSCVYTMGAAIMLIRLKVSPAIVGGYNPRGWIGLGEDRDSIAAFLFSWPDGDLSKRPLKIRKAGGPSLSVIDQPRDGIRFGSDSLKLLVPGKERMVYCRLGSHYEKMPSGERSLFGEKLAEISSIRCFVSAEGPEEWNLDGIVWNTDRKG